jgi:hypothetical protein
MSSYREVTKDDVGKMVEVSDTGSYHEKNCTRRLAFIRGGESKSRFKYFTFNDESEDYITGWKCARIRTSPLPDGWLPDDWRVLGDQEKCQRGDVVVLEASLSSVFDKELHYQMYGDYIGSSAASVVEKVEGNISVVRPRLRPATKDDVGKTVYGKDGSEAVLRLIVDADSCGYDAICMSQMLGWCFSNLCDLKVENEGWHVTH